MEEIKENISREKLPRHIAVIMDGNGRWAGRKLLARINGHRKGIEVARDIVTYSRELGVEYLTLYTFSRENWNRPAEEVGLLMGLLEKHLRGEVKTLLENNIRFRAIGNTEDLPRNVREAASALEARTRDCSSMVLQLALSYSGREEITSAARRIAMKVAEGAINPDDITEEMFRGFLYTAGVPDPDLLIRTSGEHRISNFLLWQLAYTEIYITEVLWPDFSRRHLAEAIRDYQTRERRFGLVKRSEAGVAL